MDFDNDRHDGKIFDSRPDSRKHRQESGSRPADWREEPLEPRPESHFQSAQNPTPGKSRRTSTGPLWLAFTVLLVLLVGASFYGYQTLQDESIRLDQVPVILKSMATANGRLDSLESQLHSWSADSQGLSGRMGTLERRVSANYRSTRKRAEELTAQLAKNIQDQMNARNHVVDARLEQLDSAQQSAQARIAELKQELSDAHQEIASLRQETDGDLALLHDHVAGNEQQMNNLAQQVEHKRVNFEVSKNQIAELSSEISMDLTSTDIQYQRYSGWVYYEPDRRYLWVRNQGAMQPVVFYDRSQGRQYQVVITSIREGSAAGYLLVPPTSSTLSSEVGAGESTGR
jgi:predicted  nucleic acid-binding Zn-ribbon protein